MAGILTFQRRREVLRQLAIPGEEDWELWAFTSPTEAWLVSSLPLGELDKLPPNTRIALPIRQLTALPLWLQTTDPSLFSEMIEVQLEKRGLLKSSNGRPTLFHHQVASEPDRTLLLALVLNPNLPGIYCQDLTGDYDYSARCRPLPGDGYLMWREEGRLVLALTRCNQIAYLHAFSSNELTSELASEIGCLRLRFSWENVFQQEPPPLYLLGTFSNSEQDAVRQVLQLNPQVMALPSPLFRDHSLSITPSGVTTARTQREKSKRWNHLIRQMLWIYLVIALAAFGQLGWLSYQANVLREELKGQKGTVDRLINISDRWAALQPAIDPTHYPLEILLSCVNQLPTEARLTKFDASPGKALIMGETRDAANAVKLLNNLKSDPTLKKWTWTMPQPQLLPSNQAQFQLEGTHALAPVQ